MLRENVQVETDSTMNCTIFEGNFPTDCLGLTTSRGFPNGSKKPFVQIDFTVATVFSILDCVGITLGALANILIITLVFTQAGLQFTTDIFTASLCVSDLLASVVFQPFVIRRLLARHPNQPYEWAVRRFVGQMTLSASSMSLLVATVDRYVVLRWPLRHHVLVSKAAALSIVAVVWSISFAIGVTAYLKRELAASVFLFVITLIVGAIVVFQVLIFFIAKKQVEKILKYSQTSDRRFRMLKFLKHMKATKTIILLLTVFLLSWLPSTVFRFYDRFTGGDIKTFHKWLHVLNTFIQVHCCLDPYLYVLRNQRFRSAIAKRFRRQVGFY